MKHGYKNGAVSWSAIPEAVISIRQMLPRTRNTHCNDVRAHVKLLFQYEILAVEGKENKETPHFSKVG
jgi:hypothetical protein